MKHPPRSFTEGLTEQKLAEISAAVVAVLNRDDPLQPLYHVVMDLVADVPSYELSDWFKELQHYIGCIHEDIRDARDFPLTRDQNLDGECKGAAQAAVK